LLMRGRVARAGGKITLQKMRAGVRVAEAGGWRRAGADSRFRLLAFLTKV
jgi:hypothetical protein